MRYCLTLKAHHIVNMLYDWNKPARTVDIAGTLGVSLANARNALYPLVVHGYVIKKREGRTDLFSPAMKREEYYRHCRLHHSVHIETVLKLQYEAAADKKQFLTALTRWIRKEYGEQDIQVPSVS